MKGIGKFAAYLVGKGQKDVISFYLDMRPASKDPVLMMGLKPFFKAAMTYFNDRDTYLYNDMLYYYFFELFNVT